MNSSVINWPASPNHLAGLQRWMRWVITHPLGPNQALQTSPMEMPRLDPDVEISRFVEPMPRELAAVAESPAMSRVDRIAVYSDAYFLRLLEALSTDFRTLHEVLGPQHFRAVVADYLAAHPSTSPAIGDLGRALPRFLEKHPLSFDYLFIADLARLEWNVLRSLFSDRLPPIDPASLAGIPEDAWQSARVILDPTVRLLGTAWPVELLWEDRFLPEPEGRKVLLRPRQTWLVLYRDDQWVQVRSVDAPEWFALERFQEGATLETVCADLDDLFQLKEDPAQIMGWFAQWVRDGWIKKVEFNQLPRRTS